MARGPKPKPTNLKVVAGTQRADRANPSEPRLEPAAPEPPSFLTPYARAEWVRVCDTLVTAGIMTKSDRAALAAYCQAFGRWQKAEEELAQDDLIITTTNGNQIQNPLVGTANKAMADVVRYAAEFGMTPSARSRIVALKNDAPEDPAAKFFG